MHPWWHQGRAQCTRTAREENLTKNGWPRRERKKGVKLRHVLQIDAILAS